MAARIIEPTDLIEVKNLCCLAYGQPGSKKSSMAQTAENPITFAFDEGIYRAFGRKRCVFFDSWSDVVSFDSSGHKTIVVDTVGMCLAKLAEAIGREGAKNSNRMGGLSLQGYGVLKEQFKQWVNKVRGRGQDIVFIAQERSEKNNDANYYCPDIVGGSYNTLMEVCDVVGYMHFEDKKRVIDFCPSDLWMAKVPPWKRDGHIVLPDFGSEPEFLAKLLAEAKASMGKVSAASAQTAAEVNKWYAWLQTDPSLEEFNQILADTQDLPVNTRAQVKHILVEHAKALDWRWNKDRKGYEIAKSPEEAA